MALAPLLAGFTTIAADSFPPNPLFAGGDPWVTFDNGVYYYSASYCGVATICLKSSTTLAGLVSAPWTGVWNAPAAGPNSGNVWAPEIHKVNGRWYIYYAADDGDNNHHRLFVLSADTDNPLGTWSMAATGAPSGQLVESTGNWAIDPDVFAAHDGNNYIVWSCTNFPNGTFPQATCLAPLQDALHVAGPTAQISTPVESWETRTAPIQEGPVGYSRNGRTYITYSASASWTVNDYAVGLLTNADGRFLNPGSWWKTGPIFDRHGKSYGTGSVVFIDSADGSGPWNWYHAIDRLDCRPDAYACRTIRAQPMQWAADGSPMLGYPLDPGVPQSTGDASAWGAAFGDAAEGNLEAGAMAGKWSVEDDGSVRGTSLGAGWKQVFLRRNPNLTDYTVAVEIQRTAAGTTSHFPKYGLFAAYSDANNNASVWLDAQYRVLATYAMVNGADQGWQNCPLPEAFDAAAPHRVEVRKDGRAFSVTFDGTHLAGPCNDRSFDLLNGQVGLVTEDTAALYRNVTVVPARPVFTTTSAVNSATYLARGAAPGEILSIFGSGLGPIAGAAPLALAGDPPRLPDSLAGTQVFFDGNPAPLFYVSDGMINVQAPYAIAGKTRTMVLVSYAGWASSWVPLDVVAADPGIYVGVNYDDGKRNGADAPARRGSAVVLYGTGQGAMAQPPVPTGTVAPVSPLSQVEDVAVAVGGVPAQVLFAGLTPGSVGLLQINIVIPANAPTGEQSLDVLVGGVGTAAKIWIE